MRVGGEMNKPFPVFCKDCAYSRAEQDSPWNLKCVHPKVNATDPYALASADTIPGTLCRDERAVRFIASACGQSGKLWTPKLKQRHEGLICPKCKVDRTKEACPDKTGNCGIEIVAHGD